MHRVAVFLFDDVEVLDFAGPFEVFGVAQNAASEPLFAVHTVAETPAPVRARNGLQVTPTHSFTTAPAADIVVAGTGNDRVVPGSGIYEVVAVPNDDGVVPVSSDDRIRAVRAHDDIEWAQMDLINA